MLYLYIRVVPDGFLLKSVVFNYNFISKEIRQAEHEYMNIIYNFTNFARGIKNHHIIHV